MNQQHIRVVDMLDQLGLYNANNPLVPVVAAATALFTEGAAIAASLREYLTQQVTGHTGFRGGAAERRQVCDALLDQVREISKIASTLNPDRLSRRCKVRGS